MPTDHYGHGPCYPELLAVVMAGALHVVTELTVSGFAGRVVNALLVLAFAVYLVWRARRSAGALRRWGFRRDNLRPALGVHLGFAAGGALVLLGIGAFLGRLALPATFFLTLLLYPLWGLAQQFALQNLIAGNLTALGGRLPIALAGSALFSASHYPRLELVALTFVGGVFFTLIYRRWPNLWAVALAHGLLGALAFYLVLGEDPGTMILEAVRGRPS